jgi:hypothetical protein
MRNLMVKFILGMGLFLAVYATLQDHYFAAILVTLYSIMFAVLLGD